MTYTSEPITLRSAIDGISIRRENFFQIIEPFEVNGVSVQGELVPDLQFVERGGDLGVACAGCEKSEQREEERRGEEAHGALKMSDSRGMCKGREGKGWVVRGNW